MKMRRVHDMSGALPRFPVWETVNMLFLVIYGAVGILTHSPTSMYEKLLGPWANVWFLVMLITGLMTIIALFMKIPDGLYLHFIAMSILMTAAFAMLSGLIVLQGRPFFAGSTLLYIFAFGSLARMFQLWFQIKRFRAKVKAMVEARIVKEVIDADGFPG